MRPLVMIVWGIVLVVFDVRIETIDLIPDPLGWALIAWGATLLRSMHAGDSGFTLAMVSAWVGAAWSVPWMLIGPPSFPLDIVESFLQTGVVWGLCVGLAAALRARRPDLLTSFVLIRWGDLVTTVILSVLSLATVDRSGGLVAAATVFVSALMGLVVVIWLFVLLIVHRNAPELGGSAKPQVAS